MNEVVIPTATQDQWNRGARRRREVLQVLPQADLAAAINQLYPGVVNAPETGRDDLVAVLLTGVPDLNYTGPTLADMLRINLSIPPAASPSRLGVVGGDLAGFPNGRGSRTTSSTSPSAPSPGS